MNVAAVRTSLEGLRQQAQNGTPLPHELLEAVGFQDPRGARRISRSHAEEKVADTHNARVVEAIDIALERLEPEATAREA